jgi:4-hydroxy-tetrahydrodipicolinate reductase
MVAICMAGACGRMGRRIMELAAVMEDTSIGGAFDLPEFAGKEIQMTGKDGNSQSVVIAGNVHSQLKYSNVLIDFTAAQSCLDNVRVASKAGLAVVVGTTGLSPSQVTELNEISKETAIVYAPNMSVGVNLLFKLVEEAAERLGLAYNVEITEIHHNQKKDSPSGTAVRLAERAAHGLGLDYPGEAVFGREGLVGARPERQIGVHAIRGGDVVGEHTVAFIGCGERLELTHKAHNRDNFALGALRAAHFAVKAAPGLYDMQDVLGLK